MNKDVVVGLGEIGLPLYKLLSKTFPTDGIDTINKLKKEKKILSKPRC